MRAMLVGAVESTRVALDAIAADPDWDVAALVTLPPDLAGRHSDFADLAEDAARAGATVIHAANGNAPDILDRIRASDADELFVIGWSQICCPEFLAAAGGRVIGYHPAPLPRLRGRGVIPWTILNHEPITAGTLFRIDEGVDSGPILSQRFFHVAPDETAASLYDRHLVVLREMLGGLLPRLAAGKAGATPQDERFATYAARRVPADGLIDWYRPAHEIATLIRAVGRPYPGAFTRMREDVLTIWQAAPCPADRHVASPGQIVERDAEGFTVLCGAGSGLRVTGWSTRSGAMPRQHARLGEGAA
jgi:methionyl-tRNA formyltransferase